VCGSSATDNIYRPYVPPAQEVVQRTREVEARMVGGSCVPESAWQAFFSEGCASIRPDHFMRMFAARQAAVSYLAVNAATRVRPRPPTPFRCVAD
jgi:hypothetical protein